jgi:hypothetical protein
MILTVGSQLQRAKTKVQNYLQLHYYRYLRFYICEGQVQNHLTDMHEILNEISALKIAWRIFSPYSCNRTNLHKETDYKVLMYFVDYKQNKK